MNYRYTKSHEYVLVNKNIATIGITEFAQEQLGEIVFVSLPDIGAEIDMEDEIGEIESIKATSELYAPVSGTVIKVNDAVIKNPQLINDDTEHDGWLIKVKMSDPEELDELFKQDKYIEYCEEEET